MGVAVTVSGLFWMGAALDAAETAIVVVPPGAIKPGENVAVTFGGSPEAVKFNK